MEMQFSFYFSDLMQKLKNDSERVPNLKVRLLSIFFF